MNSTCSTCLHIFMILIGIFALFYGIAGMLTTGSLFGVIQPSGIPVLVPLGIGIILFFPVLYLLVNTRKNESFRRKVVAVALSHDKITMDDISRYSGVKLPKIRGLVYDAISRGELIGSVKENTFIRSRIKTHEQITVEREVMVTRKIPESCFKCGASINPQEVEWVGPDQVRCPHCGSTMNISTERL